MPGGSTPPLAIVTGATGWLGARLVRALVAGLPEVDALRHPRPRRVRCLVQKGAAAGELRGLGVEIVEGDLTVPSSIGALVEDAAGATVFHAAGIVHPTRGPREWTDVNVDGTRTMIDAATRGGARRFVHVSSNSPVGVNRRAVDVFDETAPYAPYMGYGKSKKAAEDIVNAKHRTGAIETVIVRPPWFYGPGQPPRQTLFFRMVARGRAPLVGRGENRRSMAYVDNICQGLLLAERVPAAAGQTYWIADRRPYSFREILDTIERVLERDFGVAVARRRIRLPGLASSVAYALDGSLQALGLYNPKIHVLSELNKTIACDIGKAARELGYDPKIELEEGIRRSMAWVGANGGPLP